MDKTCENIINHNEELKLLNNLNDIYLSIFKYLKKEFKISQLEILLKTIENTDLLFKSNKVILDKYQNKIKFIENDTTQIFFIMYSNNDFFNEEYSKLKLTLEFFSSSLYNKYLEKSIHELSIVDSLTGAFNRSYLDVYVENILNISNREQKKVGFLKIGIDQLKAVVDEFDYSIADKVLIELTNTLKQSIRISDIVIKMSEDECLVILLNVMNDNNAALVSEKLINNFSTKKVVVNNDTKQILMKTICIGISLFPDDAINIDDAIKKADIALYEARNLGRSKYYKYNQENTSVIDFF